MVIEWLKIAWNGPFHVGELRQPVSVGDVLLKLLETLWRTFMTIVYLAAAVALLGFLWAVVLEPRIFPPAKKFVLAEAVFDDGTDRTVPPPRITIYPIGEKPPPEVKPFRCSPGYPLKVMFWNNGKSAVQDVSVSVTGTSEGNTTAFVDLPYLRLPRIIGPKLGWQTCYAIGPTREPDPATLSYKATVIDATYAKSAQ